ncbi:MAG: hypothetical protein HN831_00870 [Waddliaceae bacterium]|nr:hypothetical protein [Waddliaceae bacterium]
MYRFLEGLNPGDLAKFGGQDYEKDPLKGLLGTIEMDHYEIHKGKHWTVTAGIVTLPAGGDHNIVLRVPAGGSGHLVFTMGAFDAWTGGLYEGPTIGGAGTAITEANNYRASTNTPAITAEYDATINANGTILRPLLGGGTNVGGTNSSGVAGSRAEFILAPSTNYLLILDGVAGELAYIVAEWYE